MDRRNRTTSGLRLFGAALMLLGVAAAVLGLPSRGPELRRTASAFLSTDRPGITAHNSPAAAIDPNRPSRMAAADKIDTPEMSCTVSVSDDGGETWDPLDPTVPDGTTRCFWPDVAYDGAGNLLVLYTALRDRFNQSEAVWLQRYSGRQADGPPTKVAGPHAFHARLAAAGDRVLVTYVQATPGTGEHPLGIGAGPNPVVVAASDDGGRTFSPPVQVSAPEELVVQPTVVVAEEGAVVVGALDLGADLLDYQGRHDGQAGDPYEGAWRVVTWTSRDGGATFGAPSVVAEVVPPQRIYVDVTSPTPAFAVDAARGRLYAAWESGRGDARDVHLSFSDDAGATWATPSRIARDSTQALPAVAVAPGGRVDLLFYDRSKDPTDAMTEVVLASSWDGGRSFTARTVSDRPFDSRIGYGSLQGLPSLGQQLAVLSEAGRALAFWSDTRKGNVDTNAQDLALALIDVKEGRGRRWPLVGIAAVLFAGGAVLALRPPQSGARPNRR